MARTWPASPIVVAPTPLPWTSEEQLDHEALGRNIARWSKTTLSGYVVGSAVGEEPYVNEREQLQAIEIVAGARREDQIVLGGIDNGSPMETLRLATAMADAGADLLRIRMPGGGGGARIDAVEYFRQITPHVPVPIVVIARIPRVGTLSLVAEQMGKISDLPNIYAYICSDDLRFESNVRRRMSDSVQLWASNASLLLPSAMIGATGACCLFADWSPELVKRIFELVQAERFAEAMSLQESLLEADLLGMSNGVAAIKAGLALLGYDESGPRRPRLPLSPEVTDQLRSAFRTLGILPPTGAGS